MERETSSERAAYCKAVICNDGSGAAAGETCGLPGFLIGLTFFVLLLLDAISR